MQDLHRPTIVLVNPGWCGCQRWDVREASVGIASVTTDMVVTYGDWWTTGDRSPTLSEERSNMTQADAAAAIVLAEEIQRRAGGTGPHCL